MGERRARRGSDEDVSDEEPEKSPLPSREELDEYYRAMYNEYMAHEGKGRYAEALSHMLDVRDQYDALERATAELEHQREQAEERRNHVRDELAQVTQEYERARNQAQAAHQEYVQALKDEAKALEDPLAQARQEFGEVQARANQLKSTMLTEAQRTVAVERARLQTELVALRQQRDELVADNDRLTSQKTALQGELSSVVRRLSEAGVA
jgi:chromosome segregation ATPase